MFICAVWARAAGGATRTLSVVDSVPTCRRTRPTLRDGLSRSLSVPDLALRTVLLAISLVRAPADTRNARRVDSLAVTREPACATLTLIDRPCSRRAMRTEFGAEA